MRATRCSPTVSYTHLDVYKRQVMDAKGPMMIAGNDKPGFKIDLHIKDLNNALDLSLIHI